MTEHRLRHLGQAVSALFVPGDRGDRFDKAVASGAHTVIIDWEDAVAPADKARARENTLEWFLSRSPVAGSIAIRLNASDSDEHDKDLRALGELLSRLPKQIPSILLAKTESPEEVSAVSVIRDIPLEVTALIESAQGLHNATAIAQASGVVRLAFGAIDFAVDTGMSLDSDVLGYARSALVVASRVAGLGSPLDAPEVEIRDTAVAYESAMTAKRFGFGGKLLIHPAQVAPVHQAFTPNAEEVEWARSIIGNSGGALQIDGKMVDKPLVERARRIIEALEEMT